MDFFYIWSLKFTGVQKRAKNMIKCSKNMSFFSCFLISFLAFVIRSVSDRCSSWSINSFINCFLWNWNTTWFPWNSSNIYLCQYPIFRPYCHVCHLPKLYSFSRSFFQSLANELVHCSFFFIAFIVPLKLSSDVSVDLDNMKILKHTRESF